MHFDTDTSENMIFATPRRLDFARMNDIAKGLRVHPRTVWRAVTGDYAASWDRTLNPLIPIDQAAYAFRTARETISRAVLERDEMLTLREAAAFLGVSTRCVLLREKVQKDNRFRPCVRRPKFTRYSKNHLTVVRQQMDRAARMPRRAKVEG